MSPDQVEEAPAAVTDVDADGVPATDQVQPIIAGTFAVYEDGRGGYVLVTDTQAYGVVRKHVPAALVKMATGGGMLSRKLGAVFGG